MSLTVGSPPLLETDLLRTFVAISETGSFSRAARRVLRTPSAVSMQIKRLEDTLGRPLFVREGRRVSLTADGEALLGYSRRLLRINEEAVARFRAPEVEGSVRFGASEDFGSRFLPNILARFAHTHRQVEVEVSLAPSVALLERLAAGGLDLALTTTTAHDGVPGQGRVLHVEPLVWVGLRGGLAAEQDPLPLALANHGCAWRAMALDALDRAERRYRVAYSSEHTQGQLAAVRADLAVAPLPGSLANAPFQRLGPEFDLPPLGHSQIVLHRGARLGPAAAALADHVDDSFAALAGAA